MLWRVVLVVGWWLLGVGCCMLLAFVGVCCMVLTVVGCHWLLMAVVG